MNFIAALPDGTKKTGCDPDGISIGIFYLEGKMKKGKLTLVLGGARSGKSSFALRLGQGKKKKAFIATLNPLDGEMRSRVTKHKKERDKSWKTFEEEIKIPALIIELKPAYELILLDCLTLWLSNLMQRGLDVQKESEKLLGALKKNGAEVVIVSNEVGMGIVPESALGRAFRDNAGRLNQAIAQASDTVWLVSAGIPLKIKGAENG